MPKPKEKLFEVVEIITKQHFVLALDKEEACYIQAKEIRSKTVSRITEVSKKVKEIVLVVLMCIFSINGYTEEINIEKLTNAIYHAEGGSNC